MEINHRVIIDAVWTGLEPATSCVTGRHSNQLNYQTILKWRCKDSLGIGFSKKKKKIFKLPFCAFVEAKFFDHDRAKRFTVYAIRIYEYSFRSIIR